MNLKLLVSGVLLIVAIGIAGFLYRSMSGHSGGPIACTTDAKICPDGTGLGRTGPSCTFPVCPPPNVELPSAGLAFALPAGYIDTLSAGEAALIGAFDKPADSSTNSIMIRQFALGSTTPADFIRGNALLDPSDMPAPATAFTSTMIGSHRFSVVQIGRFEGVVDTAYYLTRENDVLRFDAISRGVDWTNPSLDVTKLPTNLDLRALLATLQGS